MFCCLFCLFCFVSFCFVVCSGEVSGGMQGGAVASAEAEARGLKEVGLVNVTCPVFLCTAVLQ